MCCHGEATGCKVMPGPDITASLCENLRAIKSVCMLRSMDERSLLTSPIGLCVKFNVASVSLNSSALARDTASCVVQKVEENKTNVEMVDAARFSLKNVVG